MSSARWLEPGSKNLEARSEFGRHCHPRSRSATPILLYQGLRHFSGQRTPRPRTAGAGYGLVRESRASTQRPLRSAATTRTPFLGRASYRLPGGRDGQVPAGRMQIPRTRGGFSAPGLSAPRTARPFSTSGEALSIRTCAGRLALDRRPLLKLRPDEPAQDPLGQARRRTRRLELAPPARSAG